MNKNEVIVKYMEFDLGSESYAIPLLTVREVIPEPETTTLPNGPSHFVGIMNLRGQILSVVDLRKKLTIKSKVEGLEEAVVIVDFDGISIGLIVDSINKVLNIELSQITEVPEIKSQINAKYIHGVFNNEKQLTILLDLARILNIEELKRLAETAA